MKILKICLVFFLLVGCQTNKTEKESGNHIKLNINPKNKESILLSSFVDSIEFIHLNKAGNEIISNISKVQLFNNNIFILDREGNAIFVFKKDGSFVKKIQNTGRGPGEYLQLVDFDISSNGIFLLDYPNNILHYDIDFEYIEKYNLRGLYTFSFKCYKDLFWTYNEEGSENELFHFSAINREGDTKDRFIKKDFLGKEYQWHIGSEFNIHDGNLYFSPLFDNRIYKTNGHEVEKAYTIDFGEYSFPNDQNIFKENIFSQSFNYAVKQNFWITNKYLILDFLYDSERKFMVLDKKNQSIQYGLVDNDLFPDYRFLPSWNDRNTLIEVVDAFTINEFFPFLRNEVSCLESLSEDDNPVLILYHVKK